MEKREHRNPKFVNNYLSRKVSALKVTVFE